MKKSLIPTNNGRSASQPNDHLTVPKRYLIDKYFWFVNAGILPNSLYEKAVLFVGTYSLNSFDFKFILFLGIKYLIHFIELYTFDNTPLLIDCIEKHLKYLQSLLGTQKISKKYLNYGFIHKLQHIFHHLNELDEKNFACRQIYIDQLEKFCNLFATRLDIWLKSAQLQAYLYRFGFDPCRSSVIYNSFLIPNQRRYIDPLCRVDQKFIEKIELKCCCKIMLSVEGSECYIYPEFITLEVLFDLYRGNYVGFIEMFGYIVKRLNPTQYFAKSLRTVIIEGSFLYNILTNVPVRKLKYLEKTVTAGFPIQPFLSVNSISKQLFSIVALIKDQDASYQESFAADSVSEFSNDASRDLELDLNSRKYYNRHSTNTELTKLQESVNDINYSYRFLKYFQHKYDQEMSKIKMEEEIERQVLLSSPLDKENVILMPKRSSTPLDNIQKTENIIDKTDESNNREQTNVNKSFNTKRKKDKFLSGRSSSIDFSDSIRFANITEIETDFSKFNCLDLNVNNVSISRQETDEQIADFDSLSPEEQFRLLIKETFTDYSIEHNWINHKMRLMLRCNTEETNDDIKFPYLYEKRSIRDRLFNKQSYRIKFPKRRVPHSYTNISKMQSKMTHEPPKRSWMSKAASKILSEGFKSTDRETDDSDTDSSAFGEILNAKDLQKQFPEIFAFLEKYGKQFINTFIQKKLYKKQDWVDFLSKKFNFDSSKNTLNKRICDFESIFKNVCERNSDRLEKVDDPINKKIYALLLLLSEETVTEKNFQDLQNGKGIDLPVIDRINKSQSAVPTHIGNLDEYKQKDYLPNLSRCLCQMMYDLVQIAHEGSPDIFYILKAHISMLDDIIKKISEPGIRAAFQILNIKKELLKLDFKTYTRKFGSSSSMLVMAEELSFLHDIIFKQPCCSYKISKHLGIHIVYHSLRLDDKLNAVEPFLRLPGDRRIKRIEKMCNCIIALRTKQHPTITINEYVVDIFYDFDNGNHFGAIDLLKQIMSSHNKLMTIKDHRTVVAYPSGELWVFRDTDWLKRCYNVNENELQGLDVFKKPEGLGGNFSQNEENN